MFGPCPSGHWTSHLAPRDFGHLRVGARYRVVAPFDDFDQMPHEAGESWTYLGYAYLPYDDGLSLFVSLDGAQEWHIRMQRRPEEQGEIVDRLDRYVQPADAARDDAIAPVRPRRSILARLFGR